MTDSRPDRSLAAQVSDRIAAYDSEIPPRHHHLCAGIFVTHIACDYLTTTVAFEFAKRQQIPVGAIEINPLIPHDPIAFAAFILPIGIGIYILSLEFAIRDPESTATVLFLGSLFLLGCGVVLLNLTAIWQLIHL